MSRSTSRKLCVGKREKIEETQLKVKFFNAIHKKRLCETQSRHEIARGAGFVFLLLFVAHKNFVVELDFLLLFQSLTCPNKI
jgi:hypothetical protein